jgi:hypothetical protein
MDTLLLQCGEIGAKGAEDFETAASAETTEDFLFDLGCVHALLGDGGSVPGMDMSSSECIASR